MATLVVLENPDRWNLELPGTEVVAARDYLTDPHYSSLRPAKVFNLCRAYRYQSLGYYVSLLAAARGHRPLPSVKTVHDLRQEAIVRVVSEDVQDLIDRSLSKIKSPSFVLSIYFGRNLARTYDRLSRAIFNHFPAPFLRAEFERNDAAPGKPWRMQHLRLIAGREIPESHREFVMEQAKSYFDRPGVRPSRRYRYDLALLVNPEERDAPSNSRAVKKFLKAARDLDMRAEVIGKEDQGRLAEYDALFIRETTYVNHHTYRLAALAEAEGLEVIDDALSILRCTNKVYLAESFQRQGIPCPRTVIVHRRNRDQVAGMLGYPLVLKRPDSSFSQGVIKVVDDEDLTRGLDGFFETSELVVAQEYTPSEYDWRIGVLDGTPLFACRYYMAPGHWQIIKAQGKNRAYGEHETLPVDAAPTAARELAVRAAAIAGNGFYGVDIKEIDGRFLVMEVNDNPNVDAGVEDTVLGDELYRAVMRAFFDRLEERGRTR